MEFKQVKTYGKFRNRVIKTDLWISPAAVQRNRLFVSTSSEGSNNSSANRSDQGLTVSVANEKVDENSSRGLISLPDENSTSKEKRLKSFSSNCNSQNPLLSSSDIDNNSPVVVEHSTPFSSRCHVTVRGCRLPVISPLSSESQLDPTARDIDSPNLFPDPSEEDCNSSTNENESCSNTTNDEEALASIANKNKDSCNTRSENEHSCNITNGNEKRGHNLDRTEEANKKGSETETLFGTQTSLELQIKLEKLSSDNIQNLSDQMKQILSLNESPNENHPDENKSGQNTCGNDESHSYNYQNSSTGNSLNKIQNLPKENHPIHDASSISPKNQSANVPDTNKELTSLDSRREHNKKLEDVTGADEISGDSDSSRKKRSKEAEKKPVHFTKQAINTDSVSKMLKELNLLDAKVYLKKNEYSGSFRSGTEKNQPASQNSTNDLDAKRPEDTNPSTHSDDDPPPLPCGDVHPPLPSSHLPPQQKSGKLGKRCSQEITPKNLDVHTPFTGQYAGEILKNPSYSFFVEALTPASFQRSRLRPLSPKQKILVQCEQKKPLKFSEVLAPSIMAKCVKVGEGTYGEVYKTNNGVEDVALKVIPIEGNFTVNGEQQKSFEEIIPEIVISKELSSLADCDDIQNAANVCSNFVKVKRVMLVQDSYPDKLLQEWDKWKNNHNCENERPDMFNSDQYFVVFEFLDGGEDLESFQLSSTNEALSVLQQVAISLSVAEESLMFEHRDLHWGNVLVKRSKCKTMRYKLYGQDIHVKSAGVFVSIIDFTLSRLTKDGLTVYCDLSKDPDIFKGKGDYQFQVYRLMRKANNNNWENHEPYSNVLWLRYLIDKILNAKKYKKPNNGIQRNIRTYLRKVLSYESAKQAVQDGFLAIDFPPDR